MANSDRPERKPTGALAAFGTCMLIAPPIVLSAFLATGMASPSQLSPLLPYAAVLLVVVAASGFWLMPIDGTTRVSASIGYAVLMCCLLAYLSFVFAWAHV